MIVYENSLFGFSLIFRVHGSALWKACVPALCSTAGILIYHALFIDWDVLQRGQGRHTGPFDHPYPITCYVAFFSFLLTFRLNFAYQRYWEGATAIHQMLSKWLDVATYCAAYHYQSQVYDKYRPPSFGEHVHLRNLTRERERAHRTTLSEHLEEVRASLQEKQKQPWWKKLVPRKRRPPPPPPIGGNSSGRSTSSQQGGKVISSGGREGGIQAPRRFQEQFALPNNSNHGNNNSPGRNNAMSASGGRYSLRRIASVKGDIRSVDPIHIPYPSPFLQETAHLVSLLAGVALSTLRNDIEGAQSPLAEYFPGQPLPPVDPDELSKALRKKFDSGSHTVAAVYYLLGLTRDNRHRTLYNAVRPFQILGGVSDAEVDRLQRAHGPYAKVALCSFFVQEFVAREYLTGSTGKIPGPLISRITHVLSDGMSGYNQARKLSYNPFPFPHAQMTVFFTIAVLFIFPLLYYCFVNDLAFACLLNFVTVLCFLGIHEVARELENPFHNVPNDIPLTTFQAQFNESLITIYSGFHPDSWWEVDNNSSSPKVAVPPPTPPEKDNGIATTAKAIATTAKATVVAFKEDVHPLKR
ncbi:Bestrophin, RFP-TM, chloride channel [Seminavis robusta]|uniref:Bestrophin, RFP-TM, chloride channel n=1 Tax=Seminavis robusta TaxID=568900 RepID=A0A9N8DU01_9STRA|nr:Bestrophin, RFP-TM, chloride channel [Seminavis robusta]|eukprot:Sro274_g105480.1 Bestrophin, RFP-TM, chloride channel (582) ;mRNA; r:47865-50015